MKKEIKIRALYIFVLVVAVLFLVSPFVIPIFFAATVSLTLYPLLEFLERKGVRKASGAALLTTLFGIIISIPLFFFVIKGTIAVIKKLEGISVNQKLSSQGVTAVVTDLRHNFIESVQKITERYDFLNFLNEERLNKYINLFLTQVLSYLKNFAAELPSYFILLIIMIICTYSFLAHAQQVKSFLKTLTGFSHKRMDELTLIFIKNSRQIYITNLATGGIQSLIISTTVSLLNLGDFFVVFFITLILSFIPVIGAAPVAFVFGAVAFFTGKLTPAIVLITVGAFTGIVDNILRPWIASFGESGIPSTVAFICVIGGALWLGFPGLFVGLLLGSIAYDTLPIFWEELNSQE